MSTLKLAEKFQEAGRPFELIFKSEEDHDFSGDRGFVWKSAVDWLDQFLKK